MYFTFSMLVRSAWTGPPAPARMLTLAGTPAHVPSLAMLLYKFYLIQVLLSEATAAALLP